MYFLVRLTQSPDTSPCGSRKAPSQFETCIQWDRLSHINSLNFLGSGTVLQSVQKVYPVITPLSLTWNECAYVHIFHTCPSKPAEQLCSTDSGIVHVSSSHTHTNAAQSPTAMLLQQHMAPQRLQGPSVPPASLCPTLCHNLSIRN